jgi:glycosyltransferase involved in cell wall biosynthesis
MRKSKYNLKIALIFMPINEIRPPVSSSIASAGDLVMDEIARRLARSHNVIVYCARGEGQKKVEDFGGVEYRRMSTWFDRRVLHRQKMRRLIELAGLRDEPFFSSSLWHRHFIAEVAADPSLQDCDIVHITNVSQFVPFVRARLPKTRIVLHMHCQWLEQLERAIVKRRITAADLVLGVSDFIAAGVRRRFPSLAPRCSHVYNGVDIALFARPPDLQPKPNHLVYVGRLAPEKGVHVLVDAFEMVLAHHPDAHLQLIGPESVFPLEALFPGCEDPHLLAIEPYFRPGTYPELLRAKISRFPPGSISLLNQGVKFNELPCHYHAASIFTFPSLCEESFGMPLVEAMAAATPVVATRGGAFPEIVEAGRTGLLVERSDARGLADAILQLLSDPERRERMAKAAAKRASTVFSWDHIVEELAAKYEALLV